MSDDSLRSPPPLPHGRRASTGNFKAQGSAKADEGKTSATKADATKADATKRDATKADATKADATKADATKRDAVKVPPGARQRTRSGAMRATTRPDNPLAAFKARAAPSQASKPDLVRTAVEAPAPPAPNVPRPPPRVPPPAPRTPASSAVTSRSLPPLALPPAVTSRSLPPMTPPALPQRREASAEVAPPPLPAPLALPGAHQGTAAVHPSPVPAEPVRERLDVTVSAVPHPRLPALTPIEPTPTALTVALPAPTKSESAPYELPQPVTTNSIPAPQRVPRKRALSALAGAAVLGALGVGGWLAVGTSQHVWTKATADVPAQVARARAAVPPGRAPAAKAATPAAIEPVEAKAKSEAPNEAGPAKASGLTASDASTPWLDGTEPNGCLPAESPAAGVGFEDVARAQQQQAKGRQLLMQGKLEASLSALCEAARLNPTHSGIAFEVARAALIARNAVTAARFAERSLALTPPDRRSKELLADALAWQGNVEAARAEWFGIHKLSAPTEKTIKTLHLGAMLEARTASKQGDYAQAERFLRRALAFDPENVATTTQLAHVLLLAGNPKAAQGWITRALALDASDAERYVLAGDIQEALGDRSTANHHYSRALELDPKHAVAKLRVQKQAL